MLGAPISAVIRCIFLTKQCTLLLSVQQISFSPHALQKTNQYLLTFVFCYIINAAPRKINKGSECVNCSAICWLSSDRFSPRNLFFLSSESRFWPAKSTLWDKASEGWEPLVLLTS